MKYSLTKQVNREALVELFEILSDSIDEDIPDIIWQGSEFEVKIGSKDVRCEIVYHSIKSGGEFTIKIGWKSSTAKKKPSSKKKSKDSKKKEEAIKSKTTSKTVPEKPTGVEFVEEEEDWLLDEGGWQEEEEEDFDWDDDDYEDEW